MTKIIRLTESDLTRLVKRVIEEQASAQLMQAKRNSDDKIKELDTKYRNKVFSADGQHRATITKVERFKDPIDGFNNNNPVTITTTIEKQNPSQWIFHCNRNSFWNQSLNRWVNTKLGLEQDIVSGLLCQSDSKNRQSSSLSR